MAFKNPFKSKQVKVDEVSEEAVAEDVEDRSAYNCGPCGGEGLVGADRVGNPTVCVACNGTGKVN